MPANYIIKVVETCGLSNTEAEKLWDKAKAIVKTSYSRNEDDKMFYPLVMGTFKKSLGQDCLDKLEKISAMAAAKKQETPIKAPTAKSYPRGINPDATGIWTDTIKSQKAVIKGQDTPLEQWAAAIVLFKKACKKKGIPSFTGSSNKQQTKKPGLMELSAKVDPALKILAKIEKALQAKKLLTKGQPKKFALDKIKKDGKSKLLLIVKTWKFYKNVSPATVLATILIPKFGFKKIKGNNYSVKTGAHTAIKLRYAKKSDSTAQLFLEVKILGKSWDNLKKENAKPEAHLTGWIKRGFIAQAVPDTDADTDISVENVYPIDSPEDAIHWLNTLTIPIIVNLDDEDFQLGLVDYLLKRAQKYSITPPQNLVQFKDDPKFRKTATKDYLFQSPSMKEDAGEPLYTVDMTKKEKTPKEIVL